MVGSGLPGYKMYWANTLLFTSVAGSDFFLNAGKIYVVILVLAVIFIGITVYIFRLDRKISKLEKHIRDEEGTNIL